MMLMAAIRRRGRENKLPLPNSSQVSPELNGVSLSHSVWGMSCLIPLRNEIWWEVKRKRNEFHDQGLLSPLIHPSIHSLLLSTLPSPDLSLSLLSHQASSDFLSFFPTRTWSETRKSNKSAQKEKETLNAEEYILSVDKYLKRFKVEVTTFSD